jgi:ligand-binding sensor domain-containing protein/signal transduction histidine kinase
MRIFLQSSLVLGRRNAILIGRQAALWLLLWSAGGLFAGDFGQLSEYQTTVWRVEDGLPQSTVTSMAQSADGYLWLGTQNGLVRFDGVKFRVFDENNTPAIKNSRIVRLLSDKGGALWVGTEQGGLAVLRDGRFTSYETPSRGTTHNYARVFCGANDGALWEVSCEWQLLRFSQEQFTAPLEDHAAHALAGDLVGNLWVGTDAELGVVEGGKYRTAWSRTNEANFQVEFLASSKSGGVWAAANGRLRKFDGTRWSIDLGSYGWTNRPVYDLYEDREQRLWVATLGAGLFRYETNGRVLHLTAASGLPTDFIRCVLEDNEGDIWVGAEGGGLCRLKQPKFQTLGVKQGLASDQVMSVAAALDGGIWIGTDGDGLDHWRDGEVRHFGLKDGLGNGHVWSTLQDRRGTVWAGTWDGIYEKTDSGFVGRSEGQTIGWQVLAIYEDDDGSVWLGQQAFGGITRLQNGQRTVVKIPQTSTSLDVRAIVKDGDGALWIGTSDSGLFRMRDGQFTRFGRKDGLGSDSIWCLFVDGQKNLWVGTCRGGLSLWNGGRFVTWTTKNGLVNNVICQIQEDNRGNLWLGSYGGIFRVNKQELNQSIADPERKARCVAYNIEDGLPSVECQGGFQPSSYKSPDGRFWFPTVKGLVAVDPEKVGVNALPPRVVIEDVIVDGAPLPRDRSEIGLTAKATIPPGNKRIEFQYTALSFSAPGAVRFKYRIEGLETDWQEAGVKRTAVYSRVPPGDYHFHVIACNGDGLWCDAGATLAVTALPYFWQTYWFLGLSGFVALAAVVTLVRNLERRQMRLRVERAERGRAIERERSRIAKDIHDDLGANLTEIALLSEFAQEPNASKAQVLADMQKITTKARSLTRIMDEVVWAVNPTNDTLEKFVTYTCSFAEEYLQTAKIACRLEVPEFLPEVILTSEVRHNLFLTVKESLNNIVKHAAATEVRIRIALESGSLILTVRDNGKGFGRVDDGSNGSVESGQRNGLSNMRKRIEGIAGKIEMESLPGCGARVTLMIALEQPAPL